MKHVDIALAGCLGAVIALATGIVMEWNLWLTCPIGMATAFLAYKPREILDVLGEIGSSMKEKCLILTGNPQEMISRITKKAIGFFAPVSCYLLCAAIFTVVMSAPALFLWYIGVVPVYWEAEPSRELIPIIAGSIMVGAITLGFFGVVGELHSRYPVSRGISNIFQNAADVFDETFLNSSTGLIRKKDAIALSFGIPLFLQAGVLLAPVAILDVALSLIVACSTTKRIAAMLGAVLGCSGGAICQWLGAPYAPAILIIGGTIGWFAGPILYWLHEATAVKAGPELEPR